MSVEYGLCEALHTAAILPESAPKDGDFGFNISECEKLLPKGTVDSSVERVYKEVIKPHSLYISLQQFSFYKCY